MRKALLPPPDTRPARTRRSHEALRALGFRPAFYDHATARIHPSLDLHGLPAPGHALEGLPPEVVVLRTDAGRVLAVRATLVAGFERGGFFYTRASAIRATRLWASAA